jgi:hypothetical protein
VVEIESAPPARSVSLHAIGTEFTNWGSQPTYIARTHPLDQHLELWKPAREGDALPAGTHIFPFEIALPAELPPTFAGMLTEIGYGLKAKVDLARHLDLHTEQGFVVLPSVRAIVESPAPVRVYDKLGRNVTLELPKSVYRLGDMISGVVHLTRPGEGRLRRLKIELLSRERGSAQGIWSEHVEREADVRIELEHLVEDTSFPFTFRLPDSADPSFSGEHCSLTWHISAQLEIVRAPDLAAEVEILVVEPE